jgi:hypothetical protein
MKYFPLRAPSESDYKKSNIINLRDNPGILGIKGAFLYYGDNDNYDRLHALNMKGLSNFSIFCVKGGSHNLVLDFLGAGCLQKVFDQVLD